MKHFYNFDSISLEEDLDPIIKEGPKGNVVWLIPLGGLGEIGKNMLIIESEKEIIIVDSGIMFPAEDMPGIDYLIPDIRYLIMKKDKVKAIVLTHGHEDHIGALPYVLPLVPVPVYGTELTLELLKSKLREFGPSSQSTFIELTPDSQIDFETFHIGCFSVIHSLAESLGLIIDTPAGKIVHSGDFKFDKNVINDEIADFFTLAGLGEGQTRLLLCDSTNAEKAGFSTPESAVQQTLDSLFKHCQDRIIISTFASSIPRIRGIIEIAQKYRRNVCIVGRGMETNVGIAKNLGYIDAPESLFVSAEDIHKFPDHKLLILATGSQGEPMSALTTMANNNHKWVKIKQGDRVILSATPIPGNETLVYRNINSLMRLGAEVIYENPYRGVEDFHVHASGHGSREDLKLMLSLTKPAYFMPIHGEHRHLFHHADLAYDLGYDDDHIILAEDGFIIEMNEQLIEPIAYLDLYEIMVDGYGVGDIGRSVLRDRIALAENGICVVSGVIDWESMNFLQEPNIYTKGLVYEKDSQHLLTEAETLLKSLVRDKIYADLDELNNTVKMEIRKFFKQKVRRKPITVSMIMTAGSIY